MWEKSRRKSLKGFLQVSGLLTVKTLNPSTSANCVFCPSPAGEVCFFFTPRLSGAHTPSPLLMSLSFLPSPLPPTSSDLQYIPPPILLPEAHPAPQLSLSPVPILPSREQTNHPRAHSSSIKPVRSPQSKMVYFSTILPKCSIRIILQALCSLDHPFIPSPNKHRLSIHDTWTRVCIELSVYISRLLTG